MLGNLCCNNDLIFDNCKYALFMHTTLVLGTASCSVMMKEVFSN